MIPGLLVTLITFPGVIVHEMAHQFFCRLSRVAVLNVCYFRVGNPAGFVVHEPPRSAAAHLLVGIGPFIVNTVVGALIAAPAHFPMSFHDAQPLDALLFWLGCSIAMHAFPSTGDAKAMWEAVYGNGNSAPLAVRLIALPLIGLIFLGAIGSVFWLDLIFGFLIASAIPNAIVLFLA